MGVDVNVYMEARTKGSSEWHFVPYHQFGESSDNDEWEALFEGGIFLGRYYHLSNFIEDMPSHRCGLPEDCSVELKAKFTKEDSIRCVDFSEIDDEYSHQKELMVSRIQAVTTNGIIRRLDRIESLLEGRNDVSGNAYGIEDEAVSAADVYEEFLEETFCLSKLVSTVRAFVSESMEVRLICFIC